MADNGSGLSVVIAALVLFLALDGISLGILNGCIVLGITKGIDHVLTLAAKSFIDMGFWQLGIEVVRGHEVLVNRLHLRREHADNEITCSKN